MQGSKVNVWYNILHICIKTLFSMLLVPRFTWLQWFNRDLTKAWFVIWDKLDRILPYSKLKCMIYGSEDSFLIDKLAPQKAKTLKTVISYNRA